MGFVIYSVCAVLLLCSSSVYGGSYGGGSSGGPIIMPAMGSAGLYGSTFPGALGGGAVQGSYLSGGLSGGAVMGQNTYQNSFSSGMSYDPNLSGQSSGFYTSGAFQQPFTTGGTFQTGLSVDPYLYSSQAANPLYAQGASTLTTQSVSGLAPSYSLTGMVDPSMAAQTSGSFPATSGLSLAGPAVSGGTFVGSSFPTTYDPSFAAGSSFALPYSQQYFGSSVPYLGQSVGSLASNVYQLPGQSMGTYTSTSSLYPTNPSVYPSFPVSYQTPLSGGVDLNPFGATSGQTGLPFNFPLDTAGAAASGGTATGLESTVLNAASQLRDTAANALTGTAGIGSG